MTTGVFPKLYYYQVKSTFTKAANQSYSNAPWPTQISVADVEHAWTLKRVFAQAVAAPLPHLPWQQRLHHRNISRLQRQLRQRILRLRRRQ